MLVGGLGLVGSGLGLVAIAGGGTWETIGWFTVALGVLVAVGSAVFTGGNGAQTTASTPDDSPTTTGDRSPIAQTDGPVGGNVVAAGGDVTITTTLEQARDDSLAGKVVVNASPEKLTNIYREHTSVHADELAKSFIGAWMRVEGTVGEVKLYPDAGGWIAVRLPGIARVSVYLNLTEEQRQQLLVLRKKEEIRAIGQIKAINASFVDLTDCELISPVN